MNIGDRVLWIEDMSAAVSTPTDAEHECIEMWVGRMLAIVSLIVILLLALCGG
jgi:hypothetical protein